MSVREYVGARYVPLFADPIEWDNTNVYEPLTVVKYQGGSYVSRQSVPEGIAITNTDYWILWADYNAQLQHYIDEVNTFDGRIDTLEDKFPVDTADIKNGAVTTDKIAANAVTGAKIASGAVDTTQIANNAVNYYKMADEAVTERVLKDNAVITSKITDGNVTSAKLASNVQNAIFKHAVIVGDSWSTNNYGVPDSGLWWTKVCKQLGVTPHNYAVSGMGYMQGSVTFDDKLGAARDDTAFDNSAVKYVFLQGSLNDTVYYTADQNTYAAKVRSTINKALSYFPNAQVIVMGTQNPLNATRAHTNMSILQRNACSDTGVSFVNMVWLTLGLAEMTDPLQNYHPTAEGQMEMASWVLNHINGGNPVLRNRDFALASSTNARIAGTPLLKLRGNVLYLEAAGSSTSDGYATLEFANDVLASLEYYNTYLNGHTVVDVQRAVWAVVSTTDIQFRDVPVQGTNNNGWYYGAISWLY